VGVYRVYELGRRCISTRDVVYMIMMPGDERHLSPKVPPLTHYRMLVVHSQWYEIMNDSRRGV